MSVFSDLVSYRESEARQIPGNSNFVWSVSWKLLKETRLYSLLSYDIRVYLLLCLHLFNISVRLFRILLFLCNAIFSFSFKHSEYLLLLVLYAWCLPKISHVMFALCLFYFILQNLLDSSVSDLRFLWLKDFLWFAYLSLNVVSQIP